MRKNTVKIPVDIEKRVFAVLFSKNPSKRGTIKTAPKANEPYIISKNAAVIGFMVVLLNISANKKNEINVVAVI